MTVEAEIDRVRPLIADAKVLELEKPWPPTNDDWQEVRLHTDRGTLTLRAGLHTRIRYSIQPGDVVSDIWCLEAQLDDTQQAIILNTGRERKIAIEATASSNALDEVFEITWQPRRPA